MITEQIYKQSAPTKEQVRYLDSKIEETLKEDYRYSAFAKFIKWRMASEAFDAAFKLGDFNGDTINTSFDAVINSWNETDG